MALTDAFIEDNVKELLPINSNVYNTQLDILVKGAKSKLKNEGVDNVFNQSDDVAMDYIICIAYQVAKDMDFDMDFNKTNEQYITRVNTLRTYLNARKSNS